MKRVSGATVTKPDHGSTAGVYADSRPPGRTPDHARTWTILLLDDDDSIQKLRSAILEGLGFSVLMAYSGEEGLRLMRAYPIDAVVLDYSMPGMDGEEIARRLRHRHGAIPIVLSSACSSLPESLLKLVDASVPKGMSVRALGDKIEQLLQRPVDPDPSPISLKAAPGKRRP